MTSLPPGPELDKKVCELLGIAALNGEWVTPIIANEMMRPQFVQRYPPVSTDRTVMWLVWDALAGRGFEIQLWRSRLRYGSATGASLWKQDDEDEPSALCGESGRCPAEKPEYALCLAAIAALSKEGA